MANISESLGMQVRPHEPIQVETAMYPWIHSLSAEIATVEVTLGNDARLDRQENELRFIYGSIISLNTTLRKIANTVSHSDSLSTQSAMFMGLRSVLRGEPHAGISRVEASTMAGRTLFIASRNLRQRPGLIFSVEPPQAESDKPRVLRAGLCNPDDMIRAMTVLGVHEAGRRRKRS